MNDNGHLSPSDCHLKHRMDDQDDDKTNLVEDQPDDNEDGSINSEYSVDHGINTVGRGPFFGVGLFQFRLLFLTGAVWAADAMEMMLLSFLLPTLAKEWNLSGIVVSLVGAVVFVGMLIGGTILSILADKIGRRRVVITSNAGCAVFGFLSGIAPNLTAMLIIRFFVGIFIGGGCVGYTLFAEYLPTAQRGKLLVVQQAFWSFGALFSVFLAWVTLENLTWRWYLILSSIPLWLVTSLFWIVPESVRYLHAAGEYDAAKQQLELVATFNGQPLPNGRLRHTTYNYDHSQRGQFMDICRPQYRVSSFLLYAIFWVCVFGYYGISFISERYFEQLYSSGNVYQQMMITTTSEIPALIFGVLLIDSIGRKRTLMWSFFIFSVSCLLLIIDQIQNFKIVGITLVFLARMWISLSYMVIFIYFSEYYPTWIRASALGGAVALGRTAGIGTTFAAEDMTITLGMWLYGCTGIVAFMSSLLLPIDTTDREMMDRYDDQDNTHIAYQRIPMQRMRRGSIGSIDRDDDDDVKVNET
eukprot:186212_1